MKILGTLLILVGLLGILFCLFKLFVSLIKKRSGKKKWIASCLVGLFIMFVGGGVCNLGLTPEERANMEAQRVEREKAQAEKKLQDKIDSEQKKLAEQEQKQAEKEAKEQAELERKQAEEEVKKDDKYNALQKIFIYNNSYSTLDDIKNMARQSNLYISEESNGCKIAHKKKDLLPGSPDSDYMGELIVEVDKETGMIKTMVYFSNHNYRTMYKDNQYKVDKGRQKGFVQYDDARSAIDDSWQ